jgi:uncharacterized protein YqhQ
VGGQAVLEGVMMRGVSTWAVAVRREDDGEVIVRSFPLKSALARHRALRLPVIRGISANAQVGEEEKPISGPLWVATIIVALAFAVALFFLAPVGLTSLLPIDSAAVFWIVEGVVRTGIFLGYLALLSRMRELRRVFEYHGAEHKTISCFEAGLPLDPDTAQGFSRLHPRCGTSFLLVVMIVAIFVFAPLGLPEWYWLALSRVIGIPLIAGLSFEVIKFAGRNRSRGWVRALMWPGMQLQLLTTREPDREQLAVAIAAMEAVLAVEDPRAASPAERAGMEVVA